MELEEGLIKIPFRRDLLRDILRISSKIGVSPDAVLSEAALRYIESWDVAPCDTREFKDGFEAGYREGYEDAKRIHSREIPLFLGDEYAREIHRRGG